MRNSMRPPPPRRPGTRGRPRTKGARLPVLRTVLAAPTTRWRGVTVPGWYGEAARTIALTAGTTVWYSHGTVVPIRWVPVRDPLRHFDPQALLSTDLTLEPLAIV